MSNTQKLHDALALQAESLEPAQREFVMAQFEHYKWNEERIADLERELEQGAESLDAEGKLFRQRHQLVAEQGTLFSHIMRWIKNTAAGKSDLEDFLSS